MFSDNVQLPQEQLDKIGRQVCADFTRDKLSRIEWEERNACAMKLALQVMERKTYPWENASNVKFPLLTIASIQFASRAYPALVTPELVKCKVNGIDDGTKSERADRVSRHMSYQLFNEDEDWEEEHDRLLTALPILGTMFKKTYYDPIEKHNESILVSPVDLVVSYYTKSLESARRITHIIPLYENEYIERVNAGLFNKIDLGQAHIENNANQEASDEVHGLVQESDDSDPPHIFLEQHGYLDLDGDGYKEPYIITVHKDTQKVVRIVNRFGNVEKDGEKILKITPEKHFTKYGFIPSPDGGFYDLGFGTLLGPLNESVNSIINQLVDAGTMLNLQGGFLGRGIRIKGGKNRFRPGEWKSVDNYGDDLRKGVFALPVREPSNVLFSLLGMIVQYGERLSSSTDMMVGVNPGQNQAATTTMSVVEQGMKVFNGIFKRIHRSMGMEFRKLYLLNRRFLNPYNYFEYLDDKNQVFARDYEESENDITPASDPNIISEAQKLAKAEALRNAASTYYGYNRYEIEKRYLKALEIEGIEQILPDPKGENAIPQPQDPKIEVDKAKLELAQQKAEMDNQIAQMKLKISEIQTQIDAEGQKSESQLDMAKAAKEGAMAMKIGKEIVNEGNGVRGMEEKS